MLKKTLKIRTLTPIWTGDASGKPDGLKLTGIIGSMRNMFEALIRETGGHTCDIIAKGCNHEKDKKVCPACQLFGCTGLTRAFKINWDLPKCNNPICIPETDTSAHWENRTHDFSSKYPTSIDTWMASPLKDVRGVFKPDQHKEARNELVRKLKPAFSSDYTDLEIVELRKIPGIDVIELVRELLTQMADRYALGAKLNQGWGFFELDTDSRSETTGEIQKLIQLNPFTSSQDSRIPAFDYYAYQDLEVAYKVKQRGQAWEDSLGFSWNRNPLESKLPFVALGYGLQYRLRRIVKFEAFCEEMPEEEIKFCDNINADAQEWAEQHPRLVENYFRRFDLDWKEDGAFAEYLFGSADNGKHAGFIGVSHLFNRNGKWYVRMISQCPEREYADHIYEEFKYQITHGVE